MPAVTGAPGSGGPRGDAPGFVVTVGTDHHPFDRLIGWINDWLGQHQALASEFFVQSGSARLRPACAGATFLQAGQLDRLLDGADVIICHGGPGSIADAWQRGRMPIVVPRLRRLGEVVDDHQVDFCRKLADLRRVRLAEDYAVLAGLLDEASAAPDGFRTSGPGPDVTAAVARFGELVDELVSRPARRPAPYRTWRARGAGAARVAGPAADSPEPARQPVTEGNTVRTSASSGTAAVPNEERI